jgi:hypothetical protein
MQAPCKRLAVSSISACSLLDALNGRGYNAHMTRVGQDNGPMTLYHKVLMTPN